MENTAAIFYRERLLLIDEQKVSVDSKRSVRSVLAHEIAHHWFGDLVTMKWWDDIWLNEGFATWMENKPVRDLQATWGAELVEAADTQRALDFGQLAQSCQLLSRPAETWQAGSCSGWVYANARGTGVYRTASEPLMLRRLAQVADTSLLPVERISLVGDEWALVRQGRHTVADYLSLAERLAGDRSPQVVRMVTGRLDEIWAYFVPHEMRGAYQRWIRQLLRPVAEELGWNPAADELEDQRERRASIFYTLGWAGADAAVLEMARAVITQYLDGKLIATDPTMLSMALQLAATNGDRELYDRLLARMRTDPEPMEQQRFRTALGRFTNPELVNRTLDLVFSEKVKTRDKTPMLAILLDNPSARAVTWQTIKNRWADLEGRLGVFQGLPRIVDSIAAFCDRTARDDVQRFFETHKVPAAERALRRSLERIDSCIALRNRTIEPLSLSAFLKSVPLP
jgi:aminopeptidase N